jgi:hypothetical protein
VGGLKYRTKFVDGQEYILSPYTGKWCKLITKPGPEGEKLMARAHRRAANPRTMIRLEQFAKAAKAARSQKAFIWVWLQYEAWRTKDATIAVTNGELESYGVNREMKRRAIHQYEKAGLITVKRFGREAVTVTVSDPDYTHA